MPKDRLTARFQAAATLWRDVLGWNHEQLAAQIRDDQIDILFDLAGHTAHNRMLTFVRKPAPIQITWIGYEGTTGLSAIDYLLADRYMVPEAGRSALPREGIAAARLLSLLRSARRSPGGFPAAGAAVGARDVRQLQ